VPPSAASTIKSDWLVVFNSAHPAITAKKKPIYVATATVPNYLFKIFDKVEIRHASNVGCTAFRKSTRRRK
jgi:hypothetical protein